MISTRVRGAIERALGDEIAVCSRLAGGSINDAFRVELGSGRLVFLKTHSSPATGMYEAEARGLAWLAEPGVIDTPKVLAWDRDFLLLEYLDTGARRGSFDEELGRALAALHRSGAPSFGLDHDNFVGSLPQGNAASDEWASFYGERRIRAQVALAERSGVVDSGFVRTMDSLCQRLPELVGEPEPPARLHGDLWGGNLHTGPDGQPCLIDPAVYGGHREVDLAMMQLFGGFSARVFAAYHEAYPLPSAWRDRVSLYQLYPLLVHVNLFGGGYVAQARAAAQGYL